jgi:hypothetical protein
MRFKWLLVAASSTLTAAIAMNCGVGDGSQFDDEGDSSGNGGAAGSSSSFNPTESGSGGGSSCSDPDCLGDTPQGQCDGALQIASSDAIDGARAMGLCQVSDGTTWGIVNAAWVRADGQPLTGGDQGPLGSGTTLDIGKGILNRFGNSIMPREGTQMLAISSGSARNPGEPSYQQPGDPPASFDPFTSGNWKDSATHGAPAGYPRDSPSCPGVTSGDPYDSAGLRVTIKTPRDARSFKFEFNFYTYEYPDYTCSTFNDFFVAMMTPQPPGLMDGNISFDEQGNNISVNAGFLQVCNPCVAGGKTFDCPLGYGEMAGTGFETNTNTDTCGISGSAATSWLATTAPIESPGQEITLHFAVWDSGDGVLDSTVLIDTFTFEIEEGEVGTIPLPQ